jgi:protein-S-isoprenylcysteine O-methyltransferase Ste14
MRRSSLLKGLVGVLVAIVIVVLPLMQEAGGGLLPEQVIRRHAPLFWIGFVAVSALALIVYFLGPPFREPGQPAGTSAPPPARVPRRADPVLRDLADEVHRLWVRQVLDANPIHVVPLELDLAEQPDAVRDSFEDGPPAPLREPRPLPGGARLADLFDHRFNRRCLLLGAAGAGKTTTLLELARDLLGRGDDAPVPVVLPLSRWSGRPGGLAAWVAAEVTDHYKVDIDRVRSWLRAGRLVLLLDGLDEVHPSARADCVRAINAFRRDRDCSLTALVVSSRTADYADLDVRLELGGAVVLRPLTPGQVDDRLRRAGEPLGGLRAAVGADPVLTELLTSPLMLSVAVATYQNDRVPAVPEQVSRERVFAEYLSRMLARDRTLRGTSRAAPPRFDPRATRRHLIWLARLMNRRGETIFYPDWFMPRWLPGDRHRLAAALPRGLIAGAIVGSAYFLYALLVPGAATDTGVLAVPPGVGIVVGAAVCLAVTLSAARATRRARMARISFCATVFFLAGGLIHAVIIWRNSGHDLSRGAAAGLGFGLLFGATGIGSVLLALAPAHWLVGHGGTPSRWTWPRIEREMFTGIMVAPAVGVTNGLAYGLTHHQTLGLGHAFLFGFGQGLTIGLTVGVALGLAFIFVDVDNDQPAASWRWSARRLAGSALAATGYSVIYWLVFVVGSQALVGPATGAQFGLLVGFILWLTFALGHGLIPDRLAAPPAPARALAASLRASVPPTLVITVGSAVVVAAIARASSADIVAALRRNLSTPMILAAALTFWFTGGAGWLAHHAARWTAWRGGLLPRDLIGFLAHAEERQLLHRAGGGYQFRHLTLQRHIADLDPDGTTPDAPSETSNR